MTHIQTEWDRRWTAKQNACDDMRAPDPHMLRLRGEGYTNAQIALITGRKIWDVNLELGPNKLKGR